MPRIGGKDDMNLHTSFVIDDNIIHDIIGCQCLASGTVGGCRVYEDKALKKESCWLGSFDFLNHWLPS